MTLPLFDEPETISSPLCAYEGRCPKQGRAVLGAPVTVSVTCVRQTITCLTCGATGVQSTNLVAEERSA